MLAWIVASVLFLVLLIYILIQVPAVQNFARKKVVSFLENKIHTKVEIARLLLDFPKRLVLEGVYFEDQKKDTLFYGGKMRVDIALMKLIRSQVEVNYVELNNINAKIYRTGQDTIFNYQYIVDAFTGGAKSSSPEDTTGGMQMSVDKIVLNNVGGSFRDDQTGIDFLMRVGNFKTAFKKFDLDKMVFSLPDIVLGNVSGHMYQNKPLLTPQPEAVVEAESNQPFNLQLGLKNIDIRNVRFDYKNDVSLMNADLDLDELSADIKSIDLAKLDVEVESIKLHNTNAGIVLGKSQQTVVVKEEINKKVSAQANNPWRVSINQLDLENNNIAFDDNNVAPISGGMDFKHMHIGGFKLKGNDFVFTPTTYAGNITDAGFSEKSGFSLKQFKTQFAYSDTGASLKNLYAQTDKTLLRDNVVIKYPSLDAVTKDIGKLYLDANLARTDLAVKDILLLAPQLSANLKGNETAILHINSRIRGFVNNLSIPVLQVSGIGNTMLTMSGTVKGLPDPKRTTYDFNVGNFQTTRADLQKFIPPGTVPPNIRIPERMRVSGTFKGLATNFTTNLLLQTSIGSASLKGYLNSTKETYDLKGSLNGVDVGYLVKQDTMLGKVTMSYAAKGKGFKPTSMVMDAQANVKAAFIKGYNYQNIDLIASVNKGQTVIEAGIADTSIALKLNAEALIDDKFATNIKLRLLLDSILMKPLGFAATDLRIHGSVDADIATTDPNRPEGNIILSDLVVFDSGAIYKADTIRLTAHTSDTGKVITLNSQIASATLKGNYSLTTVGIGAMQVINKYYDLGIKDTSLADNKWTLDAAIIPDSLLFAFAPSLRGTDTVRMNANYDGAKEQLNLLVNAPKVQVGTQVIDSLTIAAGNAAPADRFSYSATVQKAGSKSFQMYKTSLNGYVANNEIISRVNIKDIDDKDKYQLGIRAKQANGAITVNLTDSLMLDYNGWAVNKTNYIKYDSTGIIIHNFAISNSGQSLSINSQSENVTAPVDVNLTDFHIKTLTNLANQDSLFMDGIVNGKVLVRDMMSNPVFTSDITIDTLTIKADTVGNIKIKVDNEAANTFKADVAITGNGNDVKLGGKYFTGEGRMDFQLNVNSFTMASLKAFTMGALTQADGSVKGQVSIKGTTADPDINGDLNFENANMTPAATGEKLHLENETINISSRDISFDRFTLVDSAGNKAVINGKIFTTDYKSFSFDLDLSADDFRVLNAPKV